MQQIRFYNGSNIDVKECNDKDINALL